MPVSTVTASSNDWEVQITCILDDNYYQQVAIGYADDSSQEFDLNTDKIAPPDPPIGVSAYLEHSELESLFRKLTTSIVNPQSSYEWTLKVKTIGTAGLLNISWRYTPENIIITVNDGQTLHTLDGKGEILLEIQRNSIHEFSITAQEIEDPPIIVSPTPEAPEEPETPVEQAPEIPTTPENVPPTQEDPEEPAPPIDQTPEEPQPPTQTPENTTETQNEDFVEEIDVNETVKTPIIPSSEPEVPTQLKKVEIKSITITPNPASKTDEIIFSIVLYNPDDTAQAYTANIYLDAEMVQAKTVTVQPLSETELVHSFRDLDAGAHSIQVNEEIRKFEVTGSAIPFMLYPVLIGITIPFMRETLTKKKKT